MRAELRIVSPTLGEVVIAREFKDEAEQIVGMDDAVATRLGEAVHMHGLLALVTWAAHDSVTRQTGVSMDEAMNALVNIFKRGSCG